MSKWPPDPGLGSGPAPPQKELHEGYAGVSENKTLRQNYGSVCMAAPGNIARINTSVQIPERAMIEGANVPDHKTSLCSVSKGDAWPVQKLKVSFSESKKVTKQGFC